MNTPTQVPETYVTDAHKFLSVIETEICFKTDDTYPHYFGDVLPAISYHEIKGGHWKVTVKFPNHPRADKADITELRRFMRQWLRRRFNAQDKDIDLWKGDGTCICRAVVTFWRDTPK